LDEIRPKNVFISRAVLITRLTGRFLRMS